MGVFEQTVVTQLPGGMLRIERVGLPTVVVERTKALPTILHYAILEAPRDAA